MTDDDMRAQSDAISAEIKALRVDWRKVVKSFDDYKKSNDRKTSRFTTILAVMALMIAGVGFAVVQNNRNADRLEAIVQLVNCPENAFLLGGYDPTTRAAGEAREAYEQAFKGMAIGRAILECKQAPVPKRVTP